MKREHNQLMEEFMQDIYSRYLSSLKTIYHDEILHKPDYTKESIAPPFPDPELNDRIEKLKVMENKPFSAKSFDMIFSWIESGNTLFAYFIKHKCTANSLEALILQQNYGELLDYVSNKIFLDARNKFIHSENKTQ